MDILDFLCRFKFVIGFCAFVEEAVSQTVIAKLDAIHLAGGPRPRRVYTFNLGNLKGDGREFIMAPHFEVREGSSDEEMRSGTLRKLKQVMWSPAPPKCIFIVHAHKEQIMDIAQEVRSQPDEYLTCGREVMTLLDTDSMDGANEFFERHRAHIKDPKGWIFISHRGVARGLDLNGCEAATMIINCRFANATELVQMIGRGNRNPLRNQPITSHVFVDKDPRRTLAEMIQSDFANQDNEAI